MRGLRETRKDDAPIHLDVVPRIGGAKAQSESAPLRAAIDGEREIVARARRGALAHVEGGVAVAGGDAEPKQIGDDRVAADEKPADVGIDRGGIAVAVAIAERAKDMPPLGEVGERYRPDPAFGAPVRWAASRT